MAATREDSRRIARVLLHGALGSMGVRVAGLAAALGLQVLLARFMSLGDFGTYVYVLAWTNFLVLFTKLGLDAAALRFAATYEAQQAWGALRGYCHFSLAVVGLGSLFVAGAGALAVMHHAEPATRALWFAALAALTFNSVAQVCGGLVQGLRRIVAAQAPQQVLRPLLVTLFAAGLFVLGGERLTPAQAMTCQVVAAAAVAALMLAQLWHWLPGACRAARGDHAAWREWLQVAWPLLLVGGFNVIISQADVAMLGYLGSTTDAGLYSVASRVASLLAFVLTAVNAIAAPLFARFHGESRLDELQVTLSQAAYGIFGGSAVLFAFLAVFSDWALGLFGPAFTSATPVLRVLLVANLLNAAVGSVGYLLTMTGRQRTAMAILGSVAAVNVMGNAILIPRLGGIGAAYSTAMSIIVWNIAMYIACRRLTGLDPSIFAALRRWR